MPDSDSSGFSLPAWVTQSDHIASSLRDQDSSSSPDVEEVAGPSNLEGTQSIADNNEPAGPAEPSKPSPTTTLLTQSKVTEQPGQVPVFIPESLSSSRCIVEIGSAGSAHDLAGDSGAVGRFAVKETGAAPCMLLDLKGQIYTMKAVSSAATLCILNIRQTEAKVECLLSDYIQLQHATWSDSVQEQELHNLMADDDENYQQDALPQQDAQTTGTTAKQKAAAKPKQRPVKKDSSKAMSGKQQPPKKRQKRSK